MEKNMNSWECDKLFASEASGPQKNLKMGLGGNLKFCGYGSRKVITIEITSRKIITLAHAEAEAHNLERLPR